MLKKMFILTTLSLFLCPVSAWGSGESFFAPDETFEDFSSQTGQSCNVSLEKLDPACSSNFYISYDKNIAENIPLLPSVVALAMCDTIQSFGVDKNKVGICWINTIMINKKEIANFIIKGISLNNFGTIEIKVRFNMALLHKTLTSFTENITPLRLVLKNASSWAMISKSLKENVVIKVNSFFNATYSPLRDYQAKLFYRDEEVVVCSGTEEKRGVSRGVSTDGRLILEINGKVKVLSTGQIIPNSKPVGCI